MTTNSVPQVANNKNDDQVQNDPPADVAQTDSQVCI